ncbi:MAG: CsbD family protein [Opitutus sp.]
MKSSTQDKVEGAAKDLKGRAKEVAGRAVGNPNLQDEGTADRAAGKIQNKTGDVKKVFGK